MNFAAYSHLTDDELLSAVFSKEDATPLELELAHRLENAWMETLVVQNDA